MAQSVTLLLAPGILNDAALFAHQVEHLSDIADCRVVDTTRDDTMGAMAERALDSVSGLFALAGLSMGGYLAFELLRRASPRVTRLALLGTSAGPEKAQRTEVRRITMTMTESGRFDEALAEELPLMLHPERTADPVWRQRVVDMGSRIGPQAYLRQHRACMTRPDSRPDLARIAVPTVVICGKQDLATGLEAHEDLASSIPRARLHVIENCGHLAPMEQPEQVTKLFRNWLLEN